MRGSIIYMPIGQYESVRVRPRETKRERERENESRERRKIADHWPLVSLDHWVLCPLAYWTLHGYSAINDFLWVQRSLIILSSTGHNKQTPGNSRDPCFTQRAPQRQNNFIVYLSAYLSWVLWRANVSRGPEVPLFRKLAVSEKSDCFPQFFSLIFGRQSLLLPFLPCVINMRKHPSEWASERERGRVTIGT